MGFLTVGNIHELGHALDWGEDAICSYSNTEELMNCWNTEKSILSSTFSVNSTNVGSCHEFFAECINQYFINNENFAKYCPLSFNYIQNVLSNF